MNCPKCAALQSDDAGECSNCGVVFSRFRPRQTLSRAHPSPDAGTTRTRPIVIIVVIVFLASGAIWTLRRREARANVDRAGAVDMLDAINNKGLPTRTRLAEEERTRMYRDQATGRANKIPEGLSIAVARQAIEQCSGFTTPVEIALPKEFTSLDVAEQSYPALTAALRAGLVYETTEGNSHVVRIGTNRGGFTYRDAGDKWIFPLGRRRVTSVSERSGYGDHGEARFEFEFEQKLVGELLASDSTTFTGLAKFVRKNGQWTFADVSEHARDHRFTLVSLCK